MSNFDEKRSEPTGPSSNTEDNSGVVDRRAIDGAASSRPVDSGARPRQGSAPLLEIGDPVTYDPTMEDSYDGTLAGDSSRALHPPSQDVLPGSVPASLDWNDPHQAPPDEDEDEDDDYADDPNMGATISDRYVIDSVLGEGGMGRVYRARHKVIGKQVAIKILHTELARDKAAVGRFVREAQAASSVGNSHIVDVADFGETKDGSTYFVM